MKNSRQTELLEHLAHYGYALAVPGNPVKPEKVLKELLGQDEPRFLEGFPVVLAQVLSGKEMLGWEDRQWLPNKVFSSKLYKRWTMLMTLSFLLCRLFGVSHEVTERVRRLLDKSQEAEQTLASLEKVFSASGEVRGVGMVLSVERLKNSFRNYVVLRPEEKKLQEQKEALELELLLSVLFTPRQKELLTKRLSGKVFTKTEREYYYRVVKKRLKAVADERVHQMARKLVYS